MPAEVMMSFLETCSLDRELGFRVAIHCGPVLKNQKAANIMSAKQGSFVRIRRRLKGSPVRCVLLYSGNENEVLLLYRPERVERNLRKEKNREFLRGCGYSDISVSAVIRQLRKRYADFAGLHREFPHELGVLLEYPVEDVKEFIRQKGKGCLMEKYWKVYHDPEQAEETFRRYDQAKEQAMTEFIAGRTLRQIAV